MVALMLRDLEDVDDGEHMGGAPISATDARGVATVFASGARRLGARRATGATDGFFMPPVVEIREGTGTGLGVNFLQARSISESA